MENILTIAGCSQLMLSLWAMDALAAPPAIALGIILFIVLVGAVRQVLRDRKAAAQARRSPVRHRAPRITYR
jgi:hypothetical protein